MFPRVSETFHDALGGLRGSQGRSRSVPGFLWRFQERYMVLQGVSGIPRDVPRLSMKSLEVLWASEIQVHFRDVLGALGGLRVVPVVFQVVSGSFNGAVSNFRGCHGC